MDLTGTTAIVTGAGGVGCGRAISLRLSREGASVLCSDIDQAGGRETVRLIEASGGGAMFFRADVRVETDVRELVQFAERTFGRLALLVNNASANLHNADPFDAFAGTLQTDLFGTFYAMRAALDVMQKQAGGAIVNVSSISALWHGRRMATDAPAYDVAKSAVIRLTTSMARLALQSGVRVNCLAPGWIGTDEVRAYWEALTPEQRVARGAPVHRLLTPDDIAGAVVRLATDDSLSGRILVWWSEDDPQLVRWGDRGYKDLAD